MMAPVNGQVGKEGCTYQEKKLSFVVLQREVLTNVSFLGTNKWARANDLKGKVAKRKVKSCQWVKSPWTELKIWRIRLIRREKKELADKWASHTANSSLEGILQREEVFNICNDELMVRFLIERRNKVKRGFLVSRESLGKCTKSGHSSEVLQSEFWWRERLKNGKNDENQFALIG